MEHKAERGEDTTTADYSYADTDQTHGLEPLPVTLS